MSIHLQKGREGIDGQNSVSKRKNCYELAVNKHNNLSCKPESKAYPDLHDHSIYPLKLHAYDNVKLPLATPDKIKDNMGIARSQVSKYFEKYYY